MKKILTILLLFAIKANAQTIYYVSWSTGSDANNGTSMASPWKSLQKTENQLLNPGDKILFKRGDVWDFNNEISYFDGFDVSGSGTSGNYIELGTYGTGEKPKFRDRQTVPGWTNSSNWVSRGGNRWAIYISGVKPLTVNTRYRFWIDSVEVACPDPASATPTAVTSTARWAVTTDSLYVYSLTNPATTFTYMQKSNSKKVTGFRVNGRSYIKISNLDVGSSATTSISIYGNSSNILIDSCIAGFDGVFSPIIVRNATNGAITNNEINSGYKINNQFLFYSAEDGISLNEGTIGWDVSYNTVINMNHSGIEFDNNGSGVVQNNNVHHNYVTSPDVSYSRGFAYNAGAGASNNKFYSNVIYNTQTSNQIAAGGLDFYYNVIDSVTKPLYRPDYDRAGAALAIISYNSQQIKNVNIFNNTIVNSQNMALDIEGRRTDSITDLKVINNILVNNATGGQETNPYQIYLLDNNPIVARLTFRNNIIYKTGQSILIFYSPNSVNSGWPKTVAQFNSTNGIDGNIITGNMNVDPVFVSQTDLHLQTGSPAIDAGFNVGLPYNGTAPDIGAFETGSSNLPRQLTQAGIQLSD